MPMLLSIQTLIEQSAKYHHPNFQTATRTSGQVEYTFTPFTGTEACPRVPRGVCTDTTLQTDAYDFLCAQYDAAHSQWQDARYISALKNAANDAAALWNTYQRACHTLGTQFNALNTTPSTRWNAAISQLVAAQNTALAAAKTWDAKGLNFVHIHATYDATHLTPAAAYDKAGIDTTGWILGRDCYAYSSFDGGPAVRALTTVIDDQNYHLRKVAALTAPATEA